MRSLLWISLGTFLVVGSACGDMNGMTNMDDIDQPPTINLTDTTLSFSTGTFSIPPGDTFECFYTTVITDRELSIHNATGKQSPGGHHITVYYTLANKQSPGHHPCKDEEMVTWRMVAGAGDGGGGSGEAVVELPEGLATRVPKGAQIVTQSHYVNAALSPRKVNDQASLQLISPDQVKAYANYIVFNDADFKLPPRDSLERTTTCTIPRDLQIALYLGHMHEKGRHYKLERIDEKGNQLELLYEYDWIPVYLSHPPIKHFSREQPKLLPKGTRLRQTCRWYNDTGEEVGFPHEMCLAFMYYFPDMGDLECPIN